MKLQGRKNVSLEDRLKLQSVLVPETGCLVMTKKPCSNGYCQIRVQGKLRLAHTVSYELSGGVIPKGMQLDHLCCNPACINPKHLEPVTQSTNNRRSFERGRKVFVPRRLTQEIADEIRRIYAVGGITQAEIAEQFKVSRPHVNGILTGRRWVP